MNEGPQRVSVHRATVPLWLVLLVLAPLGLVFLTSVLVAAAILAVVAGVGALVLPFFFKRQGRPPSDTIELDPSQYRNIEARPRDRD